MKKCINIAMKLEQEKTMRTKIDLMRYRMNTTEA